MLFENVCTSIDSTKSTGNDETAVNAILSTDEDRIGPFIAYDDGSSWPDMFTEIDEMMEECIVTHLMAELRRMSRSRELEQGAPSKAVNTLPVTFSHVLRVAHKYHSLLTKEGRPGGAFVRDLVQLALDRGMLQQANLSKEGATLPNLPATSILVFEDEAHNGDVFVSVSWNKARRRIMISFGAAPTNTRWATGLQTHMKEASNPLKAHSYQKPTIKINSSIHDYIFVDSSSNVGPIGGIGESVYNDLMEKHVLPIIKKHPKSRVYVTGYGLGAGLATLVGFYAAAEPDSIVPKPVSVISVAGPYVGDAAFRAAHQLLESLGKLRHLRLCNHMDLIPTIPKISIHWNVLDNSHHPGSLFKHVGLNVRLMEGGSPVEICYPKFRTGWITGTLDEVTRGWDQLTNFSWNPLDYIFGLVHHRLSTYHQRVQSHKDTLRTLQLNDLYSRKDIVGNLVPLCRQ